MVRAAATVPPARADRFRAVVIPRASRWILAATLASGAVLGLSACGSGDTAPPTSPTTAATRAAAGGTSCPEQGGSQARYITFMNDLDTDVTLGVPRASWKCDGYSGVSTPGNLDGRLIGHPGPQPRVRMEVEFGQYSWGDTAFTLNVNAGGKTLVSLGISVFLYIGPTYPWGIKVDGKYRCYKPVVEFRDSDGQPAWATMPGNGCRASQDGDMVLHLTKIKPS